MQLLVVDGNPDVLRDLVNALRGFGWSVNGASDFATARALLHRHPDVVVASERLGEFNGLHLAIIARRADPDVHVVITAQDDDPVTTRDAEAFNATVMVKPFSGRELAEHIMRLPSTDRPIGALA